jgi:hypothetical protein
MQYGPYKVRVSTNSRQVAYSIGLPPEVGQALAHKRFFVSVTGEGIVLTPAPATPTSRVVPDDLTAVALSKKFEVTP